MIDIFMPITGPSKVYRSTSATEAEIAKYMVNTFFGLKVTFCYDPDNTLIELVEVLNSSILKKLKDN